MRAGKRWRLDGATTDIEIVLNDAPVLDAEAIEQSRREIERVLWQGLDARDPRARLVLEAIWRELHVSPLARAGDRSDGASSTQTLRDDLRFATFDGSLSVRRVDRTLTVPAGITPPEEPPPPPPSTQEGTTWFSLKVLDDVGDPVDGIDIAFTIGADRRVVPTNGAGVARLDGIAAGSSASGNLASVAAVKDKLKPRWQKPRDPNPPSGDNVVVRNLDPDQSAVGLDAETPATLVLMPRFECREIPGTHFEFGRSFVRSVALEQLARIAEELTSDDGTKGMIFGHTDLAGPEALNKELSERRAKALWALLTQDADAWEELFSGTADGPNWKEKWDLEEAQHMLNALGVTDDAGNRINENGVRDDSTKQAIHRFQAGNYPDCPAEQAPLATSDTLGKDGRKELFLAYAKRISRDPVDKGRLGKIGSAAFMGCGEFNPLSLTVKDEESRRAVIFVYDPAAEPQSLPCALRTLGPCKANCGPLPKEPDPDGKPPYRCAIYKQVAKKCPCQGGPDLSHDLILRFPVTLKEADDLPHSYTLESDDGTIKLEKKLASDGRANDKQRVEIVFQHLPLTHAYQVTCNGDGDPYGLFDFAKLPVLQARANENADDLLGDSGALNDFWIDNQDAPPDGTPDEDGAQNDDSSQGGGGGGGGSGGGGAA